MRTHSLSIGVWTMPKVRPLAFGTKSLYVYLLNNQHSHVFGVYFLPYVYIAHETGLELDRVRSAMNRLVEADLIAYDEVNEVVWVKDILAVQGFVQAKNWQMTTHILNHLSTLIHSPFVRPALEQAASRNFFAGAALDTLWDRVSHRVSHTPYIKRKEKDIKNQKPKAKSQKQETAAARETIAPLDPVMPLAWGTPEALLELWNTTFVNLGAVPYPPEDLNDIRPLINAALKAKSSRAFWADRLRQAFEASEFLQGKARPREGRSRWRTRLPWLFQGNHRMRGVKNYTLIAQDEYADRLGESQDERERRLINLVKDLEDPHESGRLPDVRRQARGHG